MLSISRLFADDTSLACSASHVPDIEGIINHDLQMICQWAERWLVSFNPSKTVGMLFTTKNVSPPNLLFNDFQIQFVDSRKHLGLTLSSNAKWAEHIKNISKSASKLLGIMRNLKFIVKRDSLQQIYISLLRPLLEYASIVWDNCTSREKETIEKIQIEAARLVTGITRSASLDNLYKEIGWMTLENRRRYQKFICIFKIMNGLTPDYLRDIFPMNVHSRTAYTLRNAHNIDVVGCRTELFASSFIPSAVFLWNELPEDIKSITSISLFRSRNLEHFGAPPVPRHYRVRQRGLSVMHTRLRNNCSNLNFDLYSNHISPFPTCSCGYIAEDVKHFFFQCPNFTEPRVKLFRELRRFHPLSLQLLLFGSDSLDYGENSFIF